MMEYKTMKAPAKKLNCILLAVYLALVLISEIFVSEYYRSVYLLLGSLIIFLFALLVSPAVLGIASGFSIDCAQEKNPAREKLLRSLFYILPTMLLLLYYFAYYPGGFTSDSIGQYEQAVSNRYNDWHPVLQTLFAFKLPLLLSGGWSGSIVLFQILVFSAVLGYTFDTAYLYAGRKYAIGTMVYILANPLLRIAMYPWKDVTFAIAALLLTTFSLHVYMSKGNWIRNPLHFTAFAVACVLATICRHNGILFTVPLLFALMFQVSGKRFAILVLVVAALTTAVKGPLYSVLEVKKPGSRQIEILGLPMNAISAAVSITPDQIDGDILDFAHQIAPQDVWEEYFIYGNYNPFKMSGKTDHSVIEQVGSKRVLEMAARCVKESPQASIKSLVKLTEGVYTITDPHPDNTSPGIAPNNLGISGRSSENILCYVFYTLSALVEDFIPHVFLYYGVVHLVLFISILATCELNRAADWKKILFALPLLVYNYGTTLLMTGNDDAPRFFYYTVLIVPVILIVFYRKEDLSA